MRTQTATLIPWVLVVALGSAGLSCQKGGTGGLLAKAAASGQALRYGEVATLTGKLTKKQFPAQNGGLEEQYVLETTRPIDVTNGPEDGPPARGETLVTLVPPPSGGLPPLLGKEVTVTGALFGQITGHHHTKVLMTVGKVEAR
jgi:hypothetical protein